MGICIKNLTESKTHVPFRDSKLTFFLKESLGGNSKTTLVCTVTKKHVHMEESVQTLKFAQRAKKIKNKAISNVIVTLIPIIHVEKSQRNGGTDLEVEIGSAIVKETISTEQHESNYEALENGPRRLNRFFKSE